MRSPQPLSGKRQSQLKANFVVRTTFYSAAARYAVRRKVRLQLKMVQEQTKSE